MDRSLQQKTTRRCPFCSEEIQSEAKKCKHCGEWLNGRESKRSEALNTTEVRRVADVHKSRGKTIMLVGFLMMLGGCGSCIGSIGGIGGEASGATAGLGILIALVGFFVVIVGRFLE